MKLDAWQNKENITLVSGINNRPITGDLWAERLKGLHVISTCPSCEHIERGKPPFDMGCRVIASWFGKEIMYWNSTAKDFGCVYWSEKK